MISIRIQTVRINVPHQGDFLLIPYWSATILVAVEKVEIIPINRIVGYKSVCHRY